MPRGGPSHPLRRLVPRTRQTSHTPCQGNSDTLGLQRTRVSLRGNGSLPASTRQLGAPGFQARSTSSQACALSREHAGPATVRCQHDGRAPSRKRAPRWPGPPLAHDGRRNRSRPRSTGRRQDCGRRPLGRPLRLGASLPVVSGNSLPPTPCLGYEAEAKFQAESIASTRTPHPAPNTPQYNTEPWDGQSDYRGPDGRLLAKMKRSGKIPEKQPQATTWHFIPSRGVIREGTAETNCAWRHRLSVSAQTSEKTADSEHPSRAATGRGRTEPPAAWGFWWLEAGCCRNKTKFVTSRSRQQAETYGPHKNEWLGPKGKQ